MLKPTKYSVRSSFRPKTAVFIFAHHDDGVAIVANFRGSGSWGGGGGNYLAPNGTANINKMRISFFLAIGVKTACRQNLSSTNVLTFFDANLVYESSEIVVGF